MEVMFVISVLLVQYLLFLPPLHSPLQRKETSIVMLASLYVTRWYGGFTCDVHNVTGFKYKRSTEEHTKCLYNKKFSFICEENTFLEEDLSDGDKPQKCQWCCDSQDVLDHQKLREHGVGARVKCKIAMKSFYAYTW